jgi:hypothetical protein
VPLNQSLRVYGVNKSPKLLGDPVHQVKRFAFQAHLYINIIAYFAFFNSLDFFHSTFKLLAFFQPDPQFLVVLNQ